MVCFVSLLQATWEVILLATTQGLVNGGRAGLFWSFVWTWIMFVPIVLSLAEMSSIAPTSVSPIINMCALQGNELPQIGPIVPISLID